MNETDPEGKPKCLPLTVSRYHHIPRHPPRRARHLRETVQAPLHARGNTWPRLTRLGPPSRQSDSPHT